MFLGRKEVFIRIVLTGAIGICSFIGDQGLKHGKTAMTRAIFDNVTHAIVGGLTWAVILNLSKKPLIQNFSSIFLCFSLSSFIDIDHFIAAGSWKLSVSNIITFYRLNNQHILFIENDNEIFFHISIKFEICFENYI